MMNYYLRTDKDGYIVGFTCSNTEPPQGGVAVKQPPPRWISVVKTRYEHGNYVTNDEPWIPMTYAKERSMAYPAVGDQLDSLWHAMNDGLLPKVEPFYSEIKAVKDKYPKPSPDAG